DILAENREKVLRSLCEAGEISIHIVGVGDPDAEYFIPLKRLPDGCPDRDAGYLVQREGPGKDQLINTRADTVALQELARELGGTYAHSQTGSEVSKMVADILAMERVVIATQHRVEYTDLTEYLVMAALVLLGALLILKTP
ncbi:MAG: hypothetical protein Q8Q39_04050, partial [bacterium]|nr:hypothetical protein [bacterium]